MSNQSFLIFLVIYVLNCIEGNKSKNVTAEGSRFLPPPLFPSIMFPVGSNTGILVALAVPLPDSPDQSAFVSYNFAALYGMPKFPADSITGPLNRV